MGAYDLSARDLDAVWRSKLRDLAAETPGSDSGRSRNLTSQREGVNRRVRP